jgi:isocitrate dehydrogenase kinase/phosphatase
MFDLLVAQNKHALSISKALIDGFNHHYSIFRYSSQHIQQRFEQHDWHAIQAANKARIDFYDLRVDETVIRLNEEFGAQTIDKNTWQEVKLCFIGLLTGHQQPELAETFFNTVMTHILHDAYFDNDYIFVRPAVSTEYIAAQLPAYRSYYPNEEGLRATLLRLIDDFKLTVPFENISRDIGYIKKSIERHFGLLNIETNSQFQVLRSLFFRNKGAYIIGRAIHGERIFPFAIPILFNDAQEALCIDTVLLEPEQISVVFSFSRAYFMVDMEVPSAYVHFLQSILPNKPKSEIYTMLGLQKHGKSLFYRDLMAHLQHSYDGFMIAPGIRGLVMLVFTLPSFPYVFKIIKDVIAPPKEVDRKIVIEKYNLVKHHDRVGRMADTWEYSNVAIPKHRMSSALISEIKQLAPSVLSETQDDYIIQHVYIERRMVPLNIYLEQADDQQLEDAVKDYGLAIKQLIAANIFPGDMLFKNFGITKHERVVFYDYDEIQYLTECNFRDIPPPRTWEDEMASEPWYTVNKHDVFPEEFASFLLGDARIKAAFLKHHADLLQASYWQQKQQQIQSGFIESVFPYPTALRFNAQCSA